MGADFDAAATFSVERIRRHNRNDPSDPKHRRCPQDQLDIDSLLAERDQLREENEQLRAVVKAARMLDPSNHSVMLARALSTLDSTEAPS